MRRRRWFCRIFGHRGKPGINGWENFMTGRFCPCGAMVDKDDREVFVGFGRP